MLTIHELDVDVTDISDASSASRKYDDDDDVPKMIPRKSLKSLKPNIYIDIDTKINEQNEILMNLQRQKVWNNSQNAKLELEVEALQRQLAAFLELERVEGKTSSSSALPVGESIGAKKVDVRVGSFKSNTDFIMCKAEDEVQLPPWNFNSRNNVSDDDSSGQGPSQIPAVSKGLKEDRHHIVNCVREKETGCRELTEMKEGELHQFTLRPRLGRRAVKKTDGHIKCDKPINQAYQYNFDRERPAHRALVAHDVEKCYNTKTKSIRRRAEESSRVLCDFRKVPEIAFGDTAESRENVTEKNDEEMRNKKNAKDPNMFVDDGYSSNEDSAVEEQGKKELKQNKLRDLNRRRRYTLDDSNKMKNKNVNSPKALGVHRGGSIFSKRDKEDEFLEDIRKESSKKHVNRSGDLPHLDSNLKNSLHVTDLSNCIGKNSGKKVSIIEKNEIVPPESQSSAVKPVLSTERKENYWTEELDSMWTETSLLLRVPITNAEDLIFVEASAEAGLLFMSELDDVARSLNILRGTLSRWLLPYDQNTRLDEQSSTPHSVLENIPKVLRGKLSEKQVYYLVRGANNVRRLVRIKIADDNDLEQARVALRTTMSFIKKLNERASKFSKSPFEFIELRPKSAMA